MLHRPPDAVTVKGYVQGGHGLNVQDLRLDVGVETNIRSAWNEEVFRIILNEMERIRQEKPWDIPKPSNALLLQAIEQKCTNLRSVYRAARPVVTNSGALETPAQLGER